MKTHNLIALSLATVFGLVASSAFAAPLSEKQQATIKQEVEQTMQSLLQNFSRADIDGILKFYSDDPGFLAPDPEGKISDNPTFRKATREFFQTVSSETIQTKHQDVRILAADTVVLAWQGSFQTQMKDGAVLKCDSYAATFVFRRIGNEWKIIYDHESGLPPQSVKPAAPTGANTEVKVP
jgi:ketosteroid isomerase-like protein